jgi:hypothetical protein
MDGSTPRKAIGNDVPVRKAAVNYVTKLYPAYDRLPLYGCE